MKFQIGTVKKANTFICQLLKVFSHLGIITLLVIAATNLAHGQNTRKDLETKRVKLLKEIESTNRMLNNTIANQKVTLDRYYTLQKQIEKRLQLIATLQQEIRLTELGISRAVEVVDALYGDVEKLREEYTLMARHAYRQKLSNNNLAFLFSSKSFNDAFKRWNYLKQYDSYRQKQAQLIQDTQEMLSMKAGQLEERKMEKERLLVSEISQKNILSQELVDSDHLLDKLRSDESRLQKDLSQKRQAHEELNKAIERIILAEIERKKQESRQLAGPSKKPEVEMAVPRKEADARNFPEASNLNKAFSSNKGKLPWPVLSGFVTRQFGTQPHPVLKKIMISNNGIDIRTEKNAQVKAVFSGEVLGMQYIPSNNYLLILQHGDYYTVYSNLEEVFVKRGDQIEVDQALGLVGLDKISGNYELHFEVWKDKNLQNPNDWLARK